jgi:putative MATE family efflux protein
MGLAAVGLVNAFATQVPVLFGLRNEAVPAAILYLRIDAVGHFLGCAMFVGNACLRGAGDTRTPMRVMVIVNLTNMAVSAALVFGVAGLIPPCGVAGIAWGTTAARLLGGSLVLLTLIRAQGASWSREGGSALLKLRLSRMAPHGEMFRRLLRIGIPAGMDGLALWLGQMVFLRIINGLAEGREQADIFAAHVTGVRIESLTYLPAYAWASAAATMVGQSLGARDENRAVRSGHIAAVQAGVQAGLLSLVYFFFAPQLYGFFSAEPQVVAVGVPAFRLLAFFQIPLAAEIVFKNALRGAGDTRYPLVFTLIGMFAVRMPLGYLAGHVLNGGLVGAWIGMCGDLLLRSILSTARFLQGGWKRVRV